MSQDPSSRPDPAGERSSADVGSGVLNRFTRAQVKALLTLASRPAAGIAGDEHGNVTEIEQRLDECLADLGGDGAGLLARATSRSASVGDLRGVKSLAKILFADAETDAQRRAVMILYHTAIAAAYARHAEHITSLRWSERNPVYAALAREFSTSAIGRVFRAALRRAAPHAEVPGPSGPRS